MFERIWVQEERGKHFVACFFFSFVFALLSILLTHYFVPFQVEGQGLKGMVAVLLASLAASYPLIRYLERRESEEEKEVQGNEVAGLLERHWTELEIYLAFFLGTTLAFGLSNSFLPQNFFSVQKAVIGSITGKIIVKGLFLEIITNNISVFLLTFLLSFLLTAGMVFILVWNASILGVFLSNLSKSVLHIPFVVLSYLPHGILEVAAYALAGISGFFLSHEFESLVEWESKRKALRLIQDSIILFVLGFGLLLAAGLLESISL